MVLFRKDCYGFDLVGRKVISFPEFPDFPQRCEVNGHLCVPTFWASVTFLCHVHLLSYTLVLTATQRPVSKFRTFSEMNTTFRDLCVAFT